MIPFLFELEGMHAETSDCDDRQDFGLEFLKPYPGFMIIRILAVVLSRSLAIFECNFVVLSAFALALCFGAMVPLPV